MGQARDAVTYMRSEIKNWLPPFGCISSSGLRFPSQRASQVTHISMKAISQICFVNSIYEHSSIFILIQTMINCIYYAL